MNENLKVLAWDGYPLSTTHFIPQTQNGKVLLLVPGVGEDQKKYEAFADFFASNGYHVYTFDFRGIGASRSARLTTIKADLKDWAVLDLDAMISYIMSMHKQQKLVIAAHGLGGILTGLSRLSKKAEAFLFVGCQSPRHDNLQGLFTKIRYAIFANVLIPSLTSALGYFPAKRFRLCDDLPKNVATQLVEWTKSLDNIVNGNESVTVAGFEQLDRRALSISFSDDKIATSAAVDEFFSLFPRLKTEKWTFTPDQVVQRSVGHGGFFRKPMKSLVWGEALNWLNVATTSARTKAA